MTKESRLCALFFSFFASLFFCCLAFKRCLRRRADRFSSISLFASFKAFLRHYTGECVCMCRWCVDRFTRLNQILFSCFLKKNKKRRREWLVATDEGEEWERRRERGVYTITDARTNKPKAQPAVLVIKKKQRKWAGPGDLWQTLKEQERKQTKWCVMTSQMMMKTIKKKRKQKNRLWRCLWWVNWWSFFDGVWAEKKGKVRERERTSGLWRRLKHCNSFWLFTIPFGHMLRGSEWCRVGFFFSNKRECYVCVRTHTQYQLHWKRREEKEKTGEEENEVAVRWEGKAQ